jgi:glycerol-3-phosphate dehydrogenase
MTRTPAALADGLFDLLILGGGITGAGVALDAAARGLRVALVDQSDFAGGTSSVSSKLVHGGLRYLEHGEFRLVREALQERGRLLANAPHLARPLPFVLPFYAGDRVPPWKWRLGLFLYDLLAGRRNVGRSHLLPDARLDAEWPGLRRQGLRGAAGYFDAQMDDARLCLAVIQTAVAHGAVAVNHGAAVGFLRRGGRIAGAHVADRIGGREYAVQARVVLNATGPWGDAVARLSGEQEGPQLRPTKGVHLVAAGRGLPAALILLHPRDGRVFFVIPWLGKTLVGTTDTLTTEGPDALAVTEADLAYLLEGFNHFLAPPLARADVLGSFAGLRPLIRARPGEPSALTREFRVWYGPSELLHVAGGKYTTYRAMAEAVTDRVCERLGQHRRCRTARLKLHGAPSGPWPAFVETATAALTSRWGLAAEAARHLVNRYGTEAERVAAYLEGWPEGAQPVAAGEPDLLAELAYQRDHEMAMQPADFLLRRTRLGLFRPGLALPPLPPP